MTNELYHHGILGQKWGVRRFQNKDGSLTAAGRKRQAKSYEKDLNKLDRSASKHAYKKDHYEAKRNKIRDKKETIDRYGFILHRNYGPTMARLTKKEKMLDKKIDREYKAMQRDDKKIKKIEDHIRKSSDYNFKSRAKIHKYAGVAYNHYVPGNKYQVRTSEKSKNKAKWDNKHRNPKRTSGF